MSTWKVRDGVQRYRCDDPNCYVEGEGRRPADAGFDEVRSPRRGMMPAGKRHFCSPRCAGQFFVNCDPGLAAGPVPRGLPGMRPLAPDWVPGWEEQGAGVVAPAADATAEEVEEQVAAAVRPVRTAAEIWRGMSRSSFDS